MIKIKLCEIDKHRNETTFRPYLRAMDIFREVGIEFVKGGPCDFAWVGQASIIDKKKSLDDSVNMGLDYVNSLDVPYFIFDGQDSATLMGTYEVFSESDAVAMFKNTLYKNPEMYRKGSPNGRIYWGDGDYKIEGSLDNIWLSGTNWLDSIVPKFYSYEEKRDIYDVSALFSYPSKTDVYEHDLHQSHHYDLWRKKCIDQVNQLDCRVAKLENGVKLSANEYYQKMADSKIIIAPFGYGEMAPRDVEAITLGSVLIKPDMSHLESLPMIYEDGETYIACKHDYSDLNEKIEYVLSDFENIRERLVNNFRNRFFEQYDSKKLVHHIYNCLIHTEYFKS